jgi:hypothetical protein
MKITAAVLEQLLQMHYIVLGAGIAVACLLESKLDHLDCTASLVYALLGSQCCCCILDSSGVKPLKNPWQDRLSNRLPAHCMWPACSLEGVGVLETSGQWLVHKLELDGRCIFTVVHGTWVRTPGTLPSAGACGVERIHHTTA